MSHSQSAAVVMSGCKCDLYPTLLKIPRHEKVLQKPPMLTINAYMCVDGLTKQPFLGRWLACKNGNTVQIIIIARITFENIFKTHFT